MLAYKICEAYIIWRKPITACKTQCQLLSRGWLNSMVSSRYKGRLFHGPWRDPVHMYRNQYMCGAMWDVEHSLAMASYTKRRKWITDAKFAKKKKINKWFEITNKTEDRGQSIPKPTTRGRRLMHEHLFMHLPAWRPPEAVGKQGSCC